METEEQNIVNGVLSANGGTPATQSQDLAMVATVEHQDADGSEKDSISTLNHEIQWLKRDRSELHRKVEEMQAELERSEVGRKAIAAHASYLEAELSRLHHDLVATESAGANSESEVENLKRVVGDLESEKAIILDANSSLKARIGELEAQIKAIEAEKQAEIISIREEMEGLEVDEGAVEEAVKQKEELEKALKELEEDKSQLQGRIADFQLELEKRDLAATVSGDRDAVVGLEVDKGLAVSWTAAAVAVASVGTVAAVATAFYLRHASQS